MNRTLLIVKTRQRGQGSDRLVLDAGMNTHTEATITVKGDPVFRLHIISSIGQRRHGGLPIGRPCQTSRERQITTKKKRHQNYNQINHCETSVSSFNIALLQ